MTGRRWGLALALGALLTPATVVSPDTHFQAEAAFPGVNGRIVFEVSREPPPLASDSRPPTDVDLFTVSSDGAGLTQLTQGTEADLYGTWSPDGTRIVFARYPAGYIYSDLYVMNADGSDLRNLTNTPLFSELGPSWSPDGTRIVFAGYSFPDQESYEDLYIMDADGTNVALVIGGRFGQVSPAWSPDGRWIAYTDQWTSTIRLISPDGARRRVLVPGHWDDPSAASWSPDGRWLAFSNHTALDGGDPDIWLVGRNGAGFTRLTGPNDTVERSPAWSPDGTEIAFVSDSNGSMQLYKMDSDGTDVVRLVELTVGWAGGPDWGRHSGG